MEGEMVMLTAVIAARTGHLDLIPVLLVGIGGTFASDFFYFYLGRTQGAKWINKREDFQRNFQKVHDRLEKHPIIVFTTYRFLYGLRSIIPFVIGTGKIRTFNFLLISTLTTTIWSIVYTSLGYVFGEAIKTQMEYIKNFEIYVMSLLLTGGILFLLYKKWRSSKSPKT